MDETIKGSVERVSYANEETGFAVLELSCDGDEVTVVGTLSDVRVGEQLLVCGNYINHASFGPQFKATAAQRILPSDAAAIERYLAGGAIAGIGPVTAHKIVAKYGAESLNILEFEPEKLLAIKGMSFKKAQAASEEFRKIRGLRNVMNSLSQLGIDTAGSLALYAVFGIQTDEIVRGNPYLLCGNPLNWEFTEADHLAESLGFEAEDKNRIRAGLIYIMRHNAGNGHTCIPSEQLMDVAAPYLQVEKSLCESVLEETADCGFLMRETIGGREFVFLPNLLAAERYIADRLSLLKGRNFTPIVSVKRELERFETEQNIVYSPDQREAIFAALTSGATVITGGPGTGKTTALKAIIALCERCGEKVALCAPTGRAAKRLSQVTGRDASTVHRLLEVDPKSARDTISFLRTEQNPLKCDTVVIDEMSMVDVELFAALLNGVRPNCRVIMVGDCDQLPAVGPGNLLGDILAGNCRNVALSSIFRQANESRIIQAAYRIVNGELPDLDEQGDDFYFVETVPQRAVRQITELVSVRIPSKYGLDPIADVQVLSPGRKGRVGTAVLNDALRERVNPPEPDKAEVRINGRLFRKGDKIMQVRNDYELECSDLRNGEVTAGVFNGDIGELLDIDLKQQQLIVRFDDRVAKYGFDKARQLEPAYAVTVHKAQGCEFDAVVLSLSDVNPKLSYRNLLYTAVTRARKLLVLVGDRATIERMVANERRSLRYTGLEVFMG